MKHMRKKLTAILLAIAMLVTLPATLFTTTADDGVPTYEFPYPNPNDPDAFVIQEALQILRFLVNLTSSINYLRPEDIAASDAAGLDAVPPAPRSTRVNARYFWEYERMHPGSVGVTINDALAILRWLVNLSNNVERRVCPVENCGRRPRNVTGAWDRENNEWINLVVHCDKCAICDAPCDRVCTPCDICDASCDSACVPCDICGLPCNVNCDHGTATPTATPTGTPGTPTGTPTDTPTGTPTDTPTGTPTDTPSGTPTDTTPEPTTPTPTTPTGPETAHPPVDPLLAPCDCHECEHPAGSLREVCPACHYCRDCDFQWFGVGHCTNCQEGLDCRAADGSFWCAACLVCSRCCLCNPVNSVPDGHTRMGRCDWCHETGPLCATCDYCVGCLWLAAAPAGNEPNGRVLCSGCFRCGDCLSIDFSSPLRPNFTWCSITGMCSGC